MWFFVKVNSTGEAEAEAEAEADSKERKEGRKMAITLNTGFKMPVVGLGVWRMEGKEIRDLVFNALNLGYRHFDCAAQLTCAVVIYIDELMLLSADYKNEPEVGEALAEALSTGLVKREDLFITTKAS
ncbi:hypothetical protein DVH24_013561 [Malus domestica]|uniref:NADP-dependent oxidoreductase domain-containing protein n=1 Tax=Malus domestica TaxID=3750 RepID=A0A498JDP5_MALDO|nr:hypothetical protein DVH24_013561 [Malus domestica]